MAITSVTVGGLQINDQVVYAVLQATALALGATKPTRPRLVEMAGRSPVYVGRQPHEKQIPLVVMLLGPTYALRKTAYDALAAVLDSDTLVTLGWTDAGVTSSLLVVSTELTPSAWYNRGTAQLIAPNPVPVVV